MSYLEAIVLGIVQGLTEFIPVSSSGHLILVRWIFGFNSISPIADKTFDVALHFGTFLALLIAVRADVVKIVKAAWEIVRTRAIDAYEKRLVVCLLISAVPAAIAGVLGEKFFEEVMGAPWIIAINLSVFGLIMLIVDRTASLRRPLEEVGYLDALLVGLAQVLALAPGTSRSGITLVAGELRGFTREAAVRFSFLISLPVIGGACAYKGLGLVTHPDMLAALGPGQFVLGIVVSFIAGYVAIEWLLRWLRTRTLLIFVIYRFALSALVFALILSGVRPATFAG